ncbi:MAG: cytochrome c biogenesis protein CcsA [Actinobacteria bacterium]|nr:cytochrome c biogenesis protein CcsA [Actinomycetota bacterium]MCL6104054.1 cytochrome c biogenesis protein CcsA [Actinomycetota bacterium]
MRFDINVLLGTGGIFLGFLSCLVGGAVLVRSLLTKRTGLLRAGRLYAFLTFGGILTACAAMIHALFTHDFLIKFVAQDNSLQTPLLYDLTGMWSGLAGSILLWTLILCGYLVCMVIFMNRDFKRSLRFNVGQKVAYKDRYDVWISVATLVGFIVSGFFFALMLGPSNPFATFKGHVPSNGTGANVLLADNPLVILHPPLLYLGLLGFMVPFAFTIASLVTGQLHPRRLEASRKWVLFAWASLSAGIFLGAWWSYQVLGWGGFWGWDPVENAALLPWLCATAYLHSSLSVKRNATLKAWSLSLIVATFSLVLLGTFLTRSGVIQSVHAFVESNLGPFLIAFFAVISGLGIGLIAARGGDLRSSAKTENLVSKDGAFLANNLLFGVFAFIVLVGTVFPLFAQGFDGSQITIGRPYFTTMLVPVSLIILFFMAVSPLLSWNTTDMAQFRRKLMLPLSAATLVLVVCVAFGVRGVLGLVVFWLGSFAFLSAFSRIIHYLVVGYKSKLTLDLLAKIGGMTVHIGVVVIAVSFTASSLFAHRALLNLAVGNKVDAYGYTFTYLGPKSVAGSDYTSEQLLVFVKGQGVLNPAVSEYFPSTTPVATPSVSSGLFQDVYLSVATLPTSKSSPVQVSVVVQPLVYWLWVGALLMLVGAGMSMPALLSHSDLSRSNSFSDEPSHKLRQGITAKDRSDHGT